jgi:hypothetical protein
MTRTTVAALLAAAGLLVGCGGHKLGKTGKLIHEKPVVLTLADHENGTLEVQSWIRSVERRSSGTIRIDPRRGWRGDDPNFDRDTIADVRAGHVDIAKISARAWDEVGVPSFRALVAPLLIDSYPLERRVLQSNVPAQMLTGAAKANLVGLAVLPGLLRKPLGISRVLRAPRDYVGARIGIRPGGVARQTIAALHAKPVVYPPGDRAAVARLDGAELDADVVSWYEPDELVAAGPWDLVLAADVLYEGRNVPVLEELLPRLTGERGEIWMADPGRPAGEDFFVRAPERWSVRTTYAPEPPHVSIRRLRPR